MEHCIEHWVQGRREAQHSEFSARFVLSAKSTVRTKNEAQSRKHLARIRNFWTAESPTLPFSFRTPYFVALIQGIQVAFL